MWPLDSISEQPPNGYFLRDLLVFNGLHTGGFASKGFIFEPPDFNNSQIGELNAFQDQLSILLASLSDNQRLQVQWFCDSDYQHELLRYNEETKRASNVWTRRCRNERFARYWSAMTERRLRRQKLILYISRAITDSPAFGETAKRLTKHYDHLLDPLQQEFEQIHQTLTGIFAGQGTRIIPMNDAEHYRHYTSFLNPSLADRFNYDPCEPLTRRSPSRRTAGTVREAARRISASGWMDTITRSSF